MSLSGLFHTLQNVPAYKRLTGGLASGDAGVITLPEAAKPYVLGALWTELGRPMVVVCARPEDARRMAEQLTAYCGEEAPIQHFAESEVLPYERLLLDASTVYQRLSALGALREHSAQRPPLVVASAMALMQRTIAPGLLDRLTHTIEEGQRLQLEPLLESWARMGYDFVPAVEGPGQASRRGGIIDIHPPGLPQPVRIELWGDQVESLRLFNPSNQRSTGAIPLVAVLPAREVLPALADHDSITDLIRDLDFSNCSTAERDRMQDDLALLMAGQSMEDTGFYAGFFGASTLLDHLSPESGALLVVLEPAEAEETARRWEAEAATLRLAKQERGELPLGFPPLINEWAGVAQVLESWPRRVEMSRWHQGSGAQAVELPFSSAAPYQSQLEQLGAELAKSRLDPVVIASQHSRRLEEVLRDAGVGVRELRTLDQEPSAGSVSVVHLDVSDGWRLHAQDPETGGQLLTLLTDTEVFGTAKRRVPRRRVASRPSILLDELTPGTFVVHVDHGVARFAGTLEMESPGQGAQEQSGQREYLVLEYAAGDKLYVPMEHLDQISAYAGGGEEPPSLTRLGTQEWDRAVRRAKESTKRLAEDLLALYAQRELAQGHAYPPDSPWQREMEDAFPYAETPDQMEAIAQVKADMELPRPMERLVCGDVGYGKTEVALRATFKAVMDSKQVAVLVPTTVLAHQHYTTFTERLGAFPIRVDYLSRFRSKAEQAEIIERLARGELDIVIGTHRLLQKDVAFKDLGLAIVDEEHRFGVAHKERLKSLRQEVDVLSMTATPLPRTLHMALSGIRDISTMETPPEERLPIKTYLAEHSDELIREALLRELDRGGQAFYLHNRVRGIQAVGEALRSLLPEARVAVAHGRMDEEHLSRSMKEFADGDADVLVCTTIIESGLDIPSVNTLIVDRADRLGLAQLYQLRGRIGRRAHRAYAYLLVPRGRRITEGAQRRLRTILAATELGAGFRIAMKDLEIRGAGDILGPEQSGHVHAVGFDLYIRLLSEAVEELRAQEAAVQGEQRPEREAPEPRIDLGLPALLPETLVEHMPARMALYQRLARLAKVEGMEDLVQELRDRFGPLPEEVHNLLHGVRVRILAKRAGVEAVTRRKDEVVLKLRDVIGDARLALQKVLGHGARVGHQQVHLPVSGEQNGGWGQTLLEVLELLEEFQRRALELTAAGTARSAS